MELALHDPEHGYYARGPERLGPGGDFFTASDLGDLFGRCVARQALEADRLLGSPDPFAYVEFGCGRGWLARDVRAAAGMGERLRAYLVDSSPGMRAAAREAVPDATIADSTASLPDGLRGMGIAVEWLDALPVHRLRRRGVELVEVFVGLDEKGALVEVEGEPTSRAALWAERYGAAPEDGDEAEACPAMFDAVAALSRPFARGLLAIVDYGHEARDLHDRSHSRGTLLAYTGHRTSEAYLERMGEQDLTAHVNLTALGEAARAAGLVPLGTTTQDRFLIANGILEAFEDADPAAHGSPARVRERLRAMRLIHPDGMGRAFRVCLFGRGLPEGVEIAGLADPFARP